MQSGGSRRQYGRRPGAFSFRGLYNIRAVVLSKMKRVLSMLSQQRRTGFYRYIETAVWLARVQRNLKLGGTTDLCSP